MTITFTQFLMPHGEQKTVSCDGMSPELEAIHNSLIAKGCRGECEMLSTGMISMTYEYKEDCTIAIEVCSNGPETMEALKRLIIRAGEQVDECIASYGKEEELA